jgi:hypothetical protein
VRALEFSLMADHPFRAVWRTRDLDAWIEKLSPEIMLRSPVDPHTR